MNTRKTTHRASRAILGSLAILAAGSIALPAPSLAQDNNSEARIRKLEAEIKALQRKVFPGGDSRYFEPQISGQPSSSTTATSPSTSAVTDILARLDAMESQIQRLTSQVEENSNTITLVSNRVAVLEGNPVAATQTVAKTTTQGATVSPASSVKPTGSTTAKTVSASATPAPAKVAQPTAERLSAVQKVAKPQTDDAADDEYSYGFRLWDAGFYPEAQQQLRLFVDKYPTHWRATYGRNLLGRAYLDDGNAREAATWFLRNYQDDKNGARAPDSLLYLAESMIAVKDTSRACIALAEFSETYPAVASGRLASQYESDRKKVTCK
ncbi:MAG: tetratricopeptide repeat protein [Sphingomonadaceae bacterium]